MRNKVQLLLTILLVLILAAACGNSGTDSSEPSNEKTPRVADSYNEVEFGGALLSIPDYFGEGSLSEDGFTLSYYADDSTQLSFLDYDADISNYTDEDIEGFRDSFFKAMTDEMGSDPSAEPVVSESANGMSIAKVTTDRETDGTITHINAAVITDPSSNIAICSALVQDDTTEYDYEDEFTNILNNVSRKASSSEDSSSAITNDDGSKKKPNEIFTYFLQQKFDEVADLEKMELRFSKEEDDVATYDICVDGNPSGIFFTYDNANTMCTIGGTLSNEEKFMRVYGLSCACLIADETGMDTMDAYDEFDSMLGELKVGSQVDRTIKNIHFSFKEVEVDGEHFVLFTDYRS